MENINPFSLLPICVLVALLGWLLLKVVRNHRLAVKDIEPQSDSQLPQKPSKLRALRPRDPVELSAVIGLFFVVLITVSFTFAAIAGVTIILEASSLNTAIYYFLLCLGGIAVTLALFYTISESEKYIKYSPEPHRPSPEKQAELMAKSKLVAFMSRRRQSVLVSIMEVVLIILMLIWLILAQILPASNITWPSSGENEITIID
ncbi:MAG: hypothetical protein WC980_04575 [Candidatus Brocadiia bacterium]